MAMTNPFAGYRVSDDWAAHRSRGSLGGVDFATPVGTPIYAPVAGSVRFEAGNGSGGYIISLALADSPGYVMQFLHCSGFNGSNRSVKAGELLGYTGGAKGSLGAGSSTGPHVHVHLVDPNGVREDVMPWFGNSAPSGIAVDGDFGSQTKRALQTALGVTADGDFGPNSTRALQSFLGVTADGSWGPATTRALQGFLGVPEDGSFGPQTVRALQASLNGGTFKKVVPAPPKPPVPPVPPKPVLSPAKQKKLEMLTARKKAAEAQLKIEQDKLPGLTKVRDGVVQSVTKLTDVFNKAKLALEKATADVVKAQADRVTAETGVASAQTRVASLQKDVVRLSDQISKIK